MSGTLDAIVEHHRAASARAKARLAPVELSRLALAAPPPRAFAAALRSGAPPRVIAEVKRASPSRGVLRPGDPATRWSAEGLARAYEAGGAAALSVLTDVRFFWGDPDALGAARQATGLPALRKDFLLEPYDVDESRFLGADAVLLIVRLLDDGALRACYERARELGMDVLVEVHADAELQRALALPEALVGINHRDLDTLVIDPDRALRLLPRVPPGRTVVAESGIGGPEDLARLSAAGISAFLIGESLAKSDDPRAVLARLVGGAP